MAVIFGIDPGSRFTGYAILETKEDSVIKLRDYGVISLSKKWSFAEKLHQLSLQLEVLMLSFQPTDMAIEKIFLGKNADSAFKLGHVRGVCMQLAAKQGAMVAEYAAKKVKKVVTGSGGASKEQVQLIACSLLGVPGSTPLDASDAMALGICHVRELEVQKTFERQKNL